jgi:tetratricopeptide (TPR) repeat protein
MPELILNRAKYRPDRRRVRENLSCSKRRISGARLSRICFVPNARTVTLNLWAMSEHTWGRLIEKAVKAEDWVGARRVIEAALRRNPRDHWLLSRLALTYYEERKYEQALHWDAMALQEAPYCPLAIWGYAGSLDMLGRYGEALSLYRGLLSWGEEELAHGDCGEGIRHARSLVADCHYRIARIWEKKRQWKRAVAEYEIHLSRRKDGCGSIYRIRDVKAHYAEVLGKARR